MRYLMTASMVAAFALPQMVRADEPKRANVPISAKLVTKKDTYKLDLAGKSADDFKKLLKDNEGQSAKLPKAPVVDLVLEFTNTSDKELQLSISGDSTTLNLELKGPGAVSVTAEMMFTADLKPNKAVTLAAGKSYSLPITSLVYGFRGVAQAAYWTEAGEYTITASFKTGISPAPKGSAKDPNYTDFGSVTIKAEPVKIKVEAPK